ncbi:ECHP enzyme, partial [Polypterus senegalus]|nr:peroxisomal bifunctional enzyme [Polypterus senegalus]MBN3291120.1 ECHP enzyme [Polypterus senegalus]
MAAYRREAGCIAVITLTNPPVNTLSSVLRESFYDTFRRANADAEVKAIVICGADGKFCGGADIKEFAGTFSGPSLVALIDDVEQSKKPVVAAIEGIALGGGLELALGCHYRIAHTKAQVGFPEVTLGLLPAAGGSQRLPRLITLTSALELITTGKRISAPEALKLGIVDKVTDKNALDMAIDFAGDIIGMPLEPRRLSLRTTPCPPDVESFLDEALASIRKQSRGAIAPLACLQAVRASVYSTFDEGLKKEQELFKMLLTSGQARALQYSFFAQRATKKWSMPSGATWKNTSSRPLRKAAVIGLGTMGRGITVALIKAGIPVIAVEMGLKQLEAGKTVIMSMLKKEFKKKQLTKAYREMASFTLDLEKLQEVDLVVEAVFENMSLKKQIFQQLSSLCSADAFLCTNTSTLDIDEIASVTSRPHLVVGMHFFAPAHVMKLLEVVYGPRTSPTAVATAMQLAQQMEKVGVVVGNCNGFVGNRMYKLYTEQAYFLLEEGAVPEQVDQVLEDYGFPMGIFKVSDLSGLDIQWKIRQEEGLTGPKQIPGGSFRHRAGCRYSPLLDILCERGCLGQKTGQGWYLYDKPGGRVPSFNPWLHKFLEEYREQHGIQKHYVGQDEILERCLYPLINMGFQILTERIAASPEDIDMINVFGYSWPRHWGGPMFYASMVGLPRVLNKLNYYHKIHPDIPTLEPSSLLKKLVANGSPPIGTWGAFIKEHNSKL